MSRSESLIIRNFFEFFNNFKRFLIKFKWFNSINFFLNSPKIQKNFPKFRETLQTLTWMNKKKQDFLKNFKEFLRIFLDFLTSENWMNCRLSWSSWKNMFFSYFSQKLVATRNVSVIIPDRIYFFCQKKKENSRSFLYLTNLLKLKFPGRIQRTETGAILFPLMRSRGVLWDFSPFIVRPASTMKVKCSHWLSEAILDEELLAAWRGRGVALYPNEINLNNVHTFIFWERNRGKSGGSCLLN